MPYLYKYVLVFSSAPSTNFALFQLDITSADKESFFSSKIRASKNEATLPFSELRGFSEMTKNLGETNTKYCRTLYPLLCLTKCRDLSSERSEEH